ncbi:MAG: hypothetical protein LAO08_03485 [Acidobacteriia bacterium]|nr:hypothetical protein [Terriglobia bacterium]
MLEKTLAVGSAEADVIKLKIASMTSDNYAVIETAKALPQAGSRSFPTLLQAAMAAGRTP